MQYFAVIILILLLIVVTHLHNWAFREINENSSTNDEGMAHVFLLALYCGAAIILLKYIILWGYPLITK